MSSEGGGTKELRLGVVCYGGSSLAIYMHGVTKELHRLVKASALLEAGLDADAGRAERGGLRASCSRAVAKENDGVRTRVVVDVVAGTSAGGINGIYLTKAIAHNLSQDALRDLWFERGDMKSAAAAADSWLPVKLRFFLLLPRALRKSPLRGDEMAQLAVRGARGDGRRRQRARTARDARAGGRPARPLRDDHRLLRLRPPGADLRPAARARLAAPPRARVHVRATARATSSSPRTTAASPSRRARPRASPASSRRSASGRSGSGCRTPTSTTWSAASAATGSPGALPENT